MLFLFQNINKLVVKDDGQKFLKHPIVEQNYFTLIYGTCIISDKIIKRYKHLSTSSEKSNTVTTLILLQR